MIYSTMESIAAPNDCGPLIHGRNRNSKHRLRVCHSTKWMSEWAGSVFRAAAIITQFRVATVRLALFTFSQRMKWSLNGAQLTGVIDESSTSAARSATNHQRISLERVSAFSPITRPNIPSYLHRDWCLHKKLPRKKKDCAPTVPVLLCLTFYETRLSSSSGSLFPSHFFFSFLMTANNGAETTFDWCRHRCRYQSTNAASHGQLWAFSVENLLCAPIAALDQPLT